MPQLLILGCGRLGLAVADLALAAGWQVTGARRDITHLPPGIRPWAVDLGHLQADWPDADAVLYVAAPGARNADAYAAVYGQGLAHAMHAIDPAKVPWVLSSSTAVYGGQGGAWVDEQSATDARRFNARALLDAEQRLNARGGCALRLAGLYDRHSRWMLSRVVAADAQVVEQPAQWSNRIRLEDAASACWMLLTAEQRPLLLNAVDDCPSPQHEVLDWIADELQRPKPTRRAPSAEDDGGKRVSNARLRSLGWRPRYPDYRSGYREVLDLAREAGGL